MEKRHREDQIRQEGLCRALIWRSREFHLPTKDGAKKGPREAIGAQIVGSEETRSMKKGQQKDHFLDNHQEQEPLEGQTKLLKKMKMKKMKKMTKKKMRKRKEEKGKDQSKP